jgi:hypothetical protein
MLYARLTMHLTLHAPQDQLVTNIDPQQSAKAMAKFADAMNKRDFALAVRALSHGYLDKFATEAAKLGPEAGNRIRFAS